MRSTCTAHNTRRVLFFCRVILAWLVLLSCNLPAPSPIATSETPAEEQQVTTEPGLVTSLIRIETGAETPLGAGTLDEQGGIMRIDKPGDPLDGFQITSPASAWTGEVALAISAQVITSHNLAPGLQIVTPLISIEATSTEIEGELYADDFLEVSLPLKISPDKFAMFFVYDEEQGILDALPLLSEDETQLTALTRHFSKIFVAEADKPALDKLNIQTGFVHGINSWQFTNQGSYIAPGGHCAGQSISAMYYFQMTGGEPLYGVYDPTNNLHAKTPTMFGDDRLGYRLASATQVRANWDSWDSKFWRKNQKNNDELTYYSFALALRANGNPIYVSIKREGGGHALVLYEKYGDRFYVSDPNYPAPNARRAIVYDRQAKKFKPYYSGPTADDLGKAYPSIYYVNRTWYLSEIQLAALWAQFENGTVGDDVFPKYALFKDPGLGVSSPIFGVITDPYLVDTATLRVKMQGQGFPGRVRVFNENLAEVGILYPSSSLVLNMNPGSTSYLFIMAGRVSSINKWRYVDGRWITFIESYAGEFNSGPLCGEAFEIPYRWQVALIQDKNLGLSGTIHFHNCPGGGQSVYHVEGKVIKGQPYITLEGVQIAGAGDLKNSTPATQTFTFTKGSPPEPNFAP